MGGAWVSDRSPASADAPPLLDGLPQNLMSPKAGGADGQNRRVRGSGALYPRKWSVGVNACNCPITDQRLGSLPQERRSRCIGGTFSSGSMRLANGHAGLDEVDRGIRVPAHCSWAGRDSRSAAKWPRHGGTSTLNASPRTSGDLLLAAGNSCARDHASRETPHWVWRLRRDVERRSPHQQRSPRREVPQPE
jgi:hypothetical protein